MDEFELELVTDPDQIIVEKKVPELIRVPATEKLHGIACCSGLFRLPTHYDGSLTRRCWGKGSCDLCGKREKRIYFLVALLDRFDNTLKWVQITNKAGRSLLEMVKQLQVNLYGSTLTIGRLRKKMESEVVVQIDPYARMPDRLPIPQNPAETIARVFGTKEKPRTMRRKPVK